MFSLIYHSLATRSFSQPELYELAASAGEKNESLSVTGFLHYKKKRFLQYLEGDKVVVSELIKTISLDNRHTVTRVVTLPDIERQYFKDWFMQYWRHDEFYQIELTDLLNDILVRMDEHIVSVR